MFPSFIGCDRIAKSEGHCKLVMCSLIGVQFAGVFSLCFFVLTSFYDSFFLFLLQKMICCLCGLHLFQAESAPPVNFIFLPRERLPPVNFFTLTFHFN